MSKINHRNLKQSFLISLFALGTTTAAFAAGNCQHPYCDRSAGYDAVHGYGGVLPDPSEGRPVAETADRQTDSVSEADRQKQELADVGVDSYTASTYKPGPVKHIVLFKYSVTTTPAEKEEIKRRFLALQQLCKRNGRNYVLSIETGSETSGERADQGLEQGFIVTFKSEGDRNYYVGQPIVADPNHYDADHQAFKDFVGPSLATNGALVFDFMVGH